MNEIKTTLSAGISGVVNTFLAVNNSVDSVEGIVSLIVSILSGIVVLYQIGRIIYRHYKDKHSKDCDCAEEIKDILDKGGK